VDLIELLVLLIEYLLNRGAPNGAQRGSIQKDMSSPLDKFLGKVSTWGLFDEVKGGGFPASQALRPAPQMSIPWNMVDYVPVLAQFAKALEALKGELFFGPTLSLQFP